MGNVLTKAEIEAFEAYQREEAERKAREARENRSIGDRFTEEFNSIVDGDTDRQDIMVTLAHLAAFFHDDDPEFRTDDSDPNNCQFNQKGFMAQLCNQAKWMRDREDKRQYYLRSEAAKKRYASAQGEIDTLELVEAETAYGRCKIVNLPILEDFLTAAKEASLACFADQWTPPVRRDTAKAAGELEDRFAHSERRSRLQGTERKTRPGG